MGVRNPYSELYGMIHTEANARPNTFYIGTIDSVSPLKISFSNIQINKFYINSDIDNFEIGQKVLVLPSSDTQQFVVVCRLSQEV